MQANKNILVCTIQHLKVQQWKKKTRKTFCDDAQHSEDKDRK